MDTSYEDLMCFPANLRPSQGAEGKQPASHRWHPASTLGQRTWDL